jgi:hypothetical protein
MTRELAASLSLDGAQTALLALHRLLPERSLPELIAASAQVGDPVRLAMFHVLECPACTTAALVGDGVSHLCARGRRLLAACHGWCPRPEAA